MGFSLLVWPLESKEKGTSRGVIPGGGGGGGGGGAGGATAPQLLANNTFFGVFTHH